MRTKGLLSIIMLLGLLFTVQAADHVEGNGTLTTKKITMPSRLTALSISTMNSRMQNPILK